ncbi:MULTISPECIES: hypothetical protein [Exiguobacterium]|uniref:hypothetical protein n=1 Tax=Exiguobacterium TaxID=33986 RepID=UPI001BEA336B|nr:MULTISPECIES: hypothetical protein [Exiguobacterium]MCT4777042.1 hypothetical protein [Exiguobacterium aquaticum]MCT4789458.1 hypothetical protein [Exiguobacterium mexicanum]
MEKQARMRSIQSYQKRWMPLHVSVVIAVGMSFALLVMNEFQTGYGIAFLAALVVLIYLEWRESQFMQRLTDEPSVQMFIRRTYLGRNAVSLFGAIGFCLLFKNGFQSNLFLWMMIFFGAVAGQAATTMYYERKIRQLDPEHPSRHDLSFTKG